MNVHQNNFLVSIDEEAVRHVSSYTETKLLTFYRVMFLLYLNFYIRALDSNQHNLFKKLLTLSLLHLKRNLNVPSMEKSLLVVYSILPFFSS